MKSMTNFKAAILILPFLASCNKATISSSKRSADSCSFDYVLEKEAEINKYTAIESQSLPKDRTDKIIDLDHAIRTTSEFIKTETSDGTYAIKSYCFVLSSKDSKERRYLEIGQTNLIRDNTDSKFNYTFSRSNEAEKLFDSIKPTLDELVESASKITIGN